MKRLPYLLGMIIFLSLVIPASGQQLYFGVSAGMNIADMKITGDGEDQKVDALNLYGIGGIVGAKLNDHFSLQLRPLYLNKGGMLNQQSPNPDIDFHLSFLEVDLSLKATTGDQLRPYILAGPSIGFLLNAELESDIGGNQVTADIMDISEKTEYSLGIGAGIEYSLWNGFLFVEGRYVFGLNNLNKGGRVEMKVDGVLAGVEEIDQGDEYMNRGFQLMAGFVLPLRND